jgi:hypothetical protein
MLPACDETVLTPDRQKGQGSDSPDNGFEMRR